MIGSVLEFGIGGFLDGVPGSAVTVRSDRRFSVREGSQVYRGTTTNRP